MNLSYCRFSIKNMSEYEDKIREAAVRITNTLKRSREEDSHAMYVLVKSKIIRGLSAGLGDAISKVEDETAREILDHVKAGLDWLIENKSFPLDEAVEQVEKEKQKSTRNQTADDPWK